ncbi:hypothetical protein HN873_000560, partial [Arachis hypogaea]
VLGTITPEILWKSRRPRFAVRVPSVRVAKAANKIGGILFYRQTRITKKLKGTLSCSIAPDVGYLNSTPLPDLNYVEDSVRDTNVTIRILPPKLDKVTLLQIDFRLPIDILKNIMQLTTESSKAAANYIRKILLKDTKQLEYRRHV